MGFVVGAVLEEEVAPNNWVTVAVQQRTVRGNGDVSYHLIELAPQFVENPGVDELIQVGVQEVSSISRTDGRASDKMRTT